MSGIPAWAAGGRQPESLDDNDTSAEWEQGSQGSAWGMLQQERGLQGVRKAMPGRSNILRAMPGGSE